LGEHLRDNLGAKHLCSSRKKLRIFFWVEESRRDMDKPLKTEEARLKAVEFLNKVAEQNDKVEEGDVDKLLKILRLLPEANMELKVMEVVGLSFRCLSKIQTENPLLLAKQKGRETISCFMVLLQVLPPSLRWLIYEAVEHMGVSCKASADSNELFALIIDAGITNFAVASITGDDPRDSFEAITMCSVLLKRALQNNSTKANQFIDVLMRNLYAEKLGDAIIKFRDNKLPPQAMEYCVRLYLFLTGKFPSRTGSKALQMKVVEMISDTYQKERTILKRVVEEYHKTGSVKNVDGIPTFDELLKI
jgi:hypothetical protein